MLCLTSARYNMKADLLRQTDQNVNSIDIDQAGNWEARQDPVSGEVIRVWVPITNDDPSTPEVEAYAIECIFRSMIDYTSNRVQSGIGERFGRDYVNIEYAKMTFPASVFLTVRDKITNVRNSQGIIYRDEELEHGIPRATIFDVLGVIPVMDPFGNHIEWLALLQRSAVQ